MSNIDNALAALGGEPVADVAPDLPTAQIPPDVLRLAREAALAKDAADEARERAADLADELKAAMQHHKLTAVEMDDRDAITISTAKKGTPQKTKGAITAVMEDMAEQALRESIEDPDPGEVKKARAVGKKKAAELWKSLPLSTPSPRLTIPKPRQVDADE